MNIILLSIVIDAFRTMLKSFTKKLEMKIRRKNRNYPDDSITKIGKKIEESDELMRNCAFTRSPITITTYL